MLGGGLADLGARRASDGSRRRLLPARGGRRLRASRFWPRRASAPRGHPNTGCTRRGRTRTSSTSSSTRRAGRSATSTSPARPSSEVSAQRTLVASIDDVLVTKLLALNEQEPDFRAVLEISRAVREQVELGSVARQDERFAVRARVLRARRGARDRRAPESASARRRRLSGIGAGLRWRARLASLRLATARGCRPSRGGPVRPGRSTRRPSCDTSRRQHRVVELGCVLDLVLRAIHDRPAPRPRRCRG